MIGSLPQHTWISRLLIVAVMTGATSFISGCSGRSVATSVQDQKGRAAQKAKAPTTEPERPASPQLDRPVSPELPASLPGEEVRLRERDLAAASPPGAGREEAESAARPPAAEVSPIEIEDVYFDFDQFTLRSDAKPILEADAQLLALHPDGRLLIEGHCDERGSSDYNLVLGERRAQAVKRFLEGQGVEASRMDVITYGKEKPFCTERNDECWQKNRRAHFIVKQP